jgi:hypothetical protein
MSAIQKMWQRREELIQAFHVAIITGMSATWRRCESLGTRPQEPDFVAGLVIESTPRIYHALRSRLGAHGVSVSMASIFCHQLPQVTFDSHSRASCELGDILFAYIHTPRSGQLVRNAMLFQAKATSNQPYRIRAAERDQLCLYSEWPDFTYTRSGFLTGQKRSVTPKTPNAGAQYLLLDDRPPHDPSSGLLGIPGTYPVGCCIPDEFLRDHNHLASELFSLFIFKTGRPFQDRATAASKGDWSQVVWDLLEIGVRKSFNRRRSGRHDSPRFPGGSLGDLDGAIFSEASSSSACSTVSEIVGQAGVQLFYGAGGDVPPDKFRDRNGSDDGRGGVSVVLIETSERESG